MPALAQPANSATAAAETSELERIRTQLGQWLAHAGVPTVPGPGTDATLFLYYDPFTEEFALGRYEAALGDNGLGATLSGAVNLARPAVSGDGSVVLFVNSDYDLCMARTADPESRQCLGMPGRIYSVAISSDARRVALVLQDPQSGEPLNSISVLDLANQDSMTYPLALPVVDGGEAEAVLYADYMTFNSDGTALLYDALSRVKFGNDPAVKCWSVFYLRLDTGKTSILAPPIKGIDTANPATSHLSNRYVAFEARQPASGTSTILISDLVAGQTSKIATVTDGFGYPFFTADDSALLYTAIDSNAESGLSLFRQNLSADRLGTNGEASLWLADAHLGVVYRRSVAGHSNALPTVTFQLSADRVSAPGPVTLTATATDSDGTITRVEFYKGGNKLGQIDAAPYVFVWNNVAPGNHLLTARATDNQGGVRESSPRLLTVSGSVPQDTQASFSIRPNGLNNVRLTLRGQPGEYIISISSDLTEWSDLYPVTIDAGGVGTVDDSGGPMNFPIMFYRVRRVAD